MNIGRVSALAKKEIIQILRDPRALALAFVLPMILLFLFGYAISLDLRNIPFAVLDESRSPASRRLISDFISSGYFDYRYALKKSSQIDSLIQRAKIRIALVIPADFEENLAAGRTAAIQVIADGADANTANISTGYVEAIIAAANRRLAEQILGRKLAIPIDIQLRFWYNADLRSQNYIIPGLIALIMTVVSALLTSLTVAREWERGNMEQIITTPVTALELALGKMIPYYLIAITDVIIAVAVGTTIYQVPFRGNIFVLISFASLFLFAVLSLGFLISVVTKSQQLAYQVAMLSSFLPTFLFSGFLFPISSMPRALQIFACLIPGKYFVKIARDLFLKGGGWGHLYTEGLILLGFSVLLIFAASRKFKKRLGH